MPRLFVPLFAVHDSKDELKPADGIFPIYSILWEGTEQSPGGQRQLLSKSPETA